LSPLPLQTGFGLFLLVTWSTDFSENALGKWSKKTLKAQSGIDNFNDPIVPDSIVAIKERIWNDQPLNDDDFVLCADEKPSIQARRRRHPTYPAQPGSPMKVEHEYKRCGAWAYLAAMDVHQAKLFGRCERKTGIAPFDRLVAQVMTQLPYNEANRVFWIVDNGSAHRGPSSVARLQQRYNNLVVVHGPVHASWLNQIEIYFSIVQRKLLTPNDFQSREQLEQRILAFQCHYEQIAKPFQWKFTRRDLNHLIKRITTTVTASNSLAA